MWAYQTTYKTSIRSTPFRLAFGLDAVMLMEFQIPSLRLQVRNGWWPRGILYWQFREPLIVWTLRFYRGSFGSVPSSSSLLSRSPSKAWSSGGFPSLSIFRCVLGMGSALVERQAQHEPDRLKANRPDRLKKPTTEFTKEDWLKSWMSVS